MICNVEICQCEHAKHGTRCTRQAVEQVTPAYALCRDCADRDCMGLRTPAYRASYPRSFAESSPGYRQQMRDAGRGGLLG